MRVRNLQRSKLLEQWLNDCAILISEEEDADVTELAGLLRPHAHGRCGGATNEDQKLPPLNARVPRPFALTRVKCGQNIPGECVGEVALLH
jgi:hypothetical protein